MLLKVAVIDLFRYAMVVLWWVDGVVEEVWNILNVDIAVDVVERVDLSDIGLCIRNIFVRVKEFVLRRKRIV